MSRRVLDNPIVLAVLGLLLEHPAHPHQMLAELHARGESHAAAITRGTLYNTVSALAETGWIASQGTERAGNRPERTVYALTAPGHQELVRRLDSRIRNPEREFSRFLGAVGYLGALGPDGAVAALAEALAAGVPRLHVIEAEYALRLARAEVEWLDTVGAEIRAGSLTWPGAAAPATPSAAAPATPSTTDPATP